MIFPADGSPAVSHVPSLAPPVAELASTRPAVLWRGAVALALLAWLPTISALPLAYVLHDQTLGIVLAAIGTGLGVVGLLLCLNRNGTSAGLLLATTSLCALVLVATITFVGNGVESNDLSRRAEVNLRDHGVAPRTREERLLAEHILDHADDPDSVEFVEWGPHALAENPTDRVLFNEDSAGSLSREIRELGTEGKIEALVRLRFRCHQAGAHGKAQYDELWCVVGGKVFVGDLILNRMLSHGRGILSGIPGGIPNFGMEKWKEELILALSKIRGAATRIENSNNLRELSLGMHRYADSHNDRLPPAVVYGANGEPLYSWRVLVLPYIDEDKLYNQFHLDEAWDSPHNRTLLARMPIAYRDPGGDPAGELGTTYYQVFDGPGAPFNSSSRPLQPLRLGPPHQNLNLQASAFQIRFPAGFQDGMSNTFLIVEAAEPVPWTSPRDLTYDPAKPFPKLFRPSRRGFVAAYADASVREVPTTTSEATIRTLITPSGGEMLPPDAPP